MTTPRFLPAATVAAAVLAVAACASPGAPMKAPPKDGELALPADYRSWPRFLPSIDKEATKQVRDIYMNPVAKGASPDKGFPNGTQMVMEIYSARTQADGTPLKDAGGRLVKGELSSIFVMGKDAGWGQDVDPALRNGNWVYAAYKADRSAGGPPASACRSCHLPLASKDFVFHYDRHFAER